MEINVKFTVDTGSAINIIDETTFKQLQSINLQKTHIRVGPFTRQRFGHGTPKFWHAGQYLLISPLRLHAKF